MGEEQMRYMRNRKTHSEKSPHEKQLDWVCALEKAIRGNNQSLVRTFLTSFCGRKKPIPAGSPFD